MIQRFEIDLDDNIRKNSFDYQKIAATEYGYIYAQTSEGKVYAYEVFERRIHKAYTTTYGSFPEGVSFPSNESFGVWAKTCSTLEKAQRILESYETKEVENG